MADDTATQAQRARWEGRARNGSVGLRSFDQGVVETLRAVLMKDEDGNNNYFVPEIDGLEPPPGMPGLPVTFSYPEDTFEKFRIPAIVVTRDTIDPAMQRWHPGMRQYRAPAPEALPVTVADGRTGFDRYEQVQQAMPVDISYTLLLYTHTRQLGNVLLDYVVRIYPPYCNIKVRDSLGDFRLYSAFMEGISMLDDVPEVGDRAIAFAVTLRVEAELDHLDPTVTKAATGARVKIQGK